MQNFSLTQSPRISSHRSHFSIPSSGCATRKVFRPPSNDREPPRALCVVPSFDMFLPSETRLRAQKYSGISRQTGRRGSVVPCAELNRDRAQTRARFCTRHCPLSRYCGRAHHWLSLIGAGAVVPAAAPPPPPLHLSIRGCLLPRAVTRQSKYCLGDVCLGIFVCSFALFCGTPARS